MTISAGVRAQLTGRGSLANAANLDIDSGGTSQALFAANEIRQILIVQNQSAGDLYINFGAAAAADSTSIKIVAGATFVMEPPGFVDVQAVNIFGATTAQAFSAKEV